MSLLLKDSDLVKYYNKLTPLEKIINAERIIRLMTFRNALGALINIAIQANLTEQQFIEYLRPKKKNKNQNNQIGENDNNAENDNNNKKIKNEKNKKKDAENDNNNKKTKNETNEKRDDKKHLLQKMIKISKEKNFNSLPTEIIVEIQSYSSPYEYHYSWSRIDKSYGEQLAHKYRPPIIMMSHLYYLYKNKIKKFYFILQKLKKLRVNVIEQFHHNEIEQFKKALILNLTSHLEWIDFTYQSTELNNFLVNLMTQKKFTNLRQLILSRENNIYGDVLSGMAVLPINFPQTLRAFGLFQFYGYLYVKDLENLKNIETIELGSKLEERAFKLLQNNKETIRKLSLNFDSKENYSVKNAIELFEKQSNCKEIIKFPKLEFFEMNLEFQNENSEYFHLLHEYIQILTQKMNKMQFIIPNYYKDVQKIAKLVKDIKKLAPELKELNTISVYIIHEVDENMTSKELDKMEKELKIKLIPPIKSIFQLHNVTVTKVDAYYKFVNKYNTWEFY